MIGLAFKSLRNKQKRQAKACLSVWRRRRDLILRCPYFCSPALIASAQKSDRYNSNDSLYPPPAALAVVPRRARSVSNPFDNK